MHRGTLVYPIAKPSTELLKDRGTDICPPGSDCARAAVQKVQAYWRRGARVALTVKKRRFVEAGAGEGGDA